MEDSLLKRLATLCLSLFLTLAIASPAIAEIGCSWDTATHFAESTDHADEHGADTPEPGGSDSSGGEGSPDSHCAFSHGHGDLAPRAGSPALPARILSFALPAAARFVSSLPPGLDRPPRS